MSSGSRERREAHAYVVLVIRREEGGRHLGMSRRTLLKMSEETEETRQFQDTKRAFQLKWVRRGVSFFFNH